MCSYSATGPCSTLHTRLHREREREINIKRITMFLIKNFLIQYALKKENCNCDILAAQNILPPIHIGKPAFYLKDNLQ